MNGTELEICDCPDCDREYSVWLDECPDCHRPRRTEVENEES